MKTLERITALVDKFPTPVAKDGKLAEVDKAATDAALQELTASGRDAVIGLVEMLVPAEKGGDSKARHALHALVIHVGGLKDETKRKVVVEALASTINSDRPKEVRAFVTRQIQLIGGKEVSPALGKLLNDEELRDPAIAALVAIKDGAAEELRAALPKAEGKARLAIVQALGTLRDTGSAGDIRKLLADRDSDTRVMAAWALANGGDGASASEMLKLSDEVQGFARTKVAQSCLLLAERLRNAGKNQEAKRIYQHLHDKRTEENEGHIREAAARGLAAK